MKPYHSNILEILSARNVRTPAVQGDIRLYRLNGRRKYSTSARGVVAVVA